MQALHLSPASQTRGSSRDGSVLVLVLVIVAVLTLGAYTFSEVMISEAESTAMYARQAESRAFADSGVELVAAIMGNPESIEDGNLYHSPTRLGAVVLRSGENPRGRGMFTVVAPLEGDAKSSAVRIGVSDESAKLNLNALLKYGLDDTQARVMLMAIPDMTEDVADAILDWLDEDDIPREYGSESEYYESLPTPYSASNSQFKSLDELLKVAGVTPDLLYGEDTNRNGLLDPNEDDGDASRPMDNKDGMLMLGWNSFLTIDAIETNLRADGTSKININDGLLSELYDKLVEEYDDENIARFVVAFRMYGPKPDPNQPQDDGTQQSTTGNNTQAKSGSGTGSGNGTGGGSGNGTGGGGGNNQGSRSGSNQGNSNQSNSNSNSSSSNNSNSSRNSNSSSSSGSSNSNSSNSSGGGGDNPQLSQGQLAQAANALGKVISGGIEGAVTRGGMNLAAGAKYEMKSVYELIGSTVVAEIEGKQVELASPWEANPQQINSYITDLVGKLSTTPNQTVEGRINVGEARYEVLMTIPGMTEDVAASITASSIIGPDGSPNPDLLKERATPIWLVTQGIVDLPTLVKLDRYVTARGSVARAQVVGFFQEGGGYTRLEVVIDASKPPAKVLSVKDLTDLGRGYSTPLLMGTQTRP